MVKKNYLQCWRPRFKPWVGKIPWRRAQQCSPVFLPTEFHGQRSLAGCCSWDCKELDMTEQLTLLLFSLSRTLHFPGRNIITPYSTGSTKSIWPIYTFRLFTHFNHFKSYFHLVYTHVDIRGKNHNNILWVWGLFPLFLSLENPTLIHHIIHFSFKSEFLTFKIFFGSVILLLVICSLHAKYLVKVICK